MKLRAGTLVVVLGMLAGQQAASAADTSAPNAPTGFHVTTRTPTTLGLAWTPSTDNVGVDYYNVHLDQVKVGAVNGPSYTYAGLSCGTTYHLSVRAFDAAGNPSPASQIVATTSSCPDSTPPSPPSALRVTSKTKTSIDLAWTASTDNVGVTSYHVHRDYVKVATTTGTGYSYAGLACGVTYKLSVRAYDGAGNASAASEISAATAACTGDVTPPNAPPSVTATNVKTTSITISWQPATDASGVSVYGVYRSGTLLGTTATLSWTASGLTCGTSYSFGVDARDAAGNKSPQATIATATSHCPDVTVTVDRAVQTGSSSLTLGATHGHHSADWWEDPVAITSAHSILKSSVTYQAQLIYGWGAENPQPSKTSFDWQSLDNRIADMRATGATPVIMLCCAPDWMTSLGTNTTSYPLTPPTPAHYADFVALVRKIAQRYPDVKNYVFWNQMKGWWSSSLGNWNYVEYTKLYNRVYDALKVINPAIKVGGPYLAIDGTGDPLSARNVELIDYWLANKRGADFMAFTYAVVPWVSPVMPSPASILASTGTIEKVNQQLKAKTTLPLWWVEDYFDGDFNRLDYASHDFQAAAMGSVLLHEVRTGVSASFRFQPEGNASVGYQGNQQSLWSDTSTVGGGKAFPLASVYALVKSKFPAGTKLYKTTSSSVDIEALASSTTTMLVNKRPSTVYVSVNGQVVQLAPYQVTSI